MLTMPFSVGWQLAQLLFSTNGATPVLQANQDVTIYKFSIHYLTFDCLSNEIIAGAFIQNAF
jgi:hypothetical protein